MRPQWIEGCGQEGIKSNFKCITCAAETMATKMHHKKKEMRIPPDGGWLIVLLLMNRRWWGDDPLRQRGGEHKDVRYRMYKMTEWHFVIEGGGGGGE